jgi:uncharacterized Zn-binding protein involved in type VI secretion
MSGLPATRVTDQFAHSSALGGLLTGLAIGLAVGVFIVATGGVGAIAVGAAIGVAGAGGMAGQAIGGTVMGPPTGAIATGSPNVLTNNLQQAATVIGIGPCSKESGVPQQVATGAETVLVNNMPAARKDEKMTCSATIISGSANVLIGGASVQVLPMEPEVPTWLSNTMLAMAFGGGLIATGGIAAAYGGVVALGSFSGGLIGGQLGGMGGQWAAQQMGFGATGQAIGGVLGGFGGGMLGGFGGFKGGARLFPKQPTTLPPPAAPGKVPPWLQRMRDGNDFNKQQSAKYPHNEVSLDIPPGAKGHPRVDSYKPGSEIVSRKHTQLGEVQPKTANAYLDEFANKYPPGSKIANVDSQLPGSGHQNAGLAGKELKGQMILEVPPQNQPVPPSVIQHADDLNIIIRDSNGKVYP